MAYLGYLNCSLQGNVYLIVNKCWLMQAAGHSLQGTVH
jgi:hypothetical protein